MTDTARSMPRRWGAWCEDPAAISWLKALADRDPATNFLVVRHATKAEALWADVPRVSFVDDWQALLVTRSLDAMFVAATSDEGRAALRQFAEADRPVWIWPDAQHGLPFAYELALIAQDRPDQLRGVWQHRSDSELQRLAARSSVDQHAAWEYIELERRIARTTEEDAEAMRRQFLCDLDLVRWLGGAATRVTSLRTFDGQGRLWKQSAMLASDAGPGGTWSGEFTAAEDAGARLALHHRDGATVLRADGDGLWRNESAASVDHHADVDAASWADVVRVFEWFDACEYSLERRRTIELHSEPVSERTVFKTQMTAVGCLLLMATLLFALIYLAIGATVPLPAWLLFVLRALVFAPLAVFLIAQLLLPLARPPQRSESADR